METLVLGRISGVFGVRGWVKVQSFTDPHENILDYPEWLTDAGSFALEQGQRHGKGLIAKLKSVADRDTAVALIGQEIRVPRTALPKPAKDEFYWRDLVDCEVTNLQSIPFGRVDHLFSTGANDVMVVRGERERLLPFIRDVIREVDLDRRQIQVDWDAEF